MDERLVSELIDDGANLFESHGYCVVKVTEAGEAKKIKLPITSRGVSDLMDELRAKAPTPPVKTEDIDPESKEGEDLEAPGLIRRVTFDFTDPEYLRQSEKHNQEFLWQVVIKGLEISWKTKDGTGIEDYEQRKSLLKSKGLAYSQLLKIFKAVQGLTRFQEDREDFLPGGLSA